MKRLILFLLILIVAGNSFYIWNEQRKTTFYELMDAVIESDKKIHEITIAQYKGNTQTAEGWISLTDPKKIDQFLSEVAKTDLKASGNLAETSRRFYHIQIIHSEGETLSISTTGDQAQINNTRVGLVPDTKPVDFATSYTILGEDFFSRAANMIDFAGE